MAQVPPTHRQALKLAPEGGTASSPRIGNTEKPVYPSSFIYPNPARDMATLHLEAKVNKLMGLMIYSPLSGLSSIYIVKPNIKDFSFTLNNISPGFYYYSIVDGEETVSNGKFAVVR